MDAMSPKIAIYPINHALARIQLHNNLSLDLAHLSTSGKYDGIHAVASAGGVRQATRTKGPLPNPHGRTRCTLFTT